MRQWSMADRMKATPKDHLFGNLRTLEKMVGEMPKGALRHEMRRRVEAALSWEPLITSKETD